MSEPKKNEVTAAGGTGGASPQPPATAGDVKMVAKPKGVRIRALAPIRVGEVTAGPGEVLEVSEADAKEFCDRKFQGNYSFSGERSDVTAERHFLCRAERVGAAPHAS